MTEQMIIRLERKKKEKLNYLARAEGKSSSQVIRELVQEYIVQHDLKGYIDDLWERARKKMVAAGSGPGDVKRAVARARREKA